MVEIVEKFAEIYGIRSNMLYVRRVKGQIFAGGGGNDAIFLLACSRSFIVRKARLTYRFYKLDFLLVFSFLEINVAISRIIRDEIMKKEHLSAFEQYLPLRSFVRY